VSVLPTLDEVNATPWNGLRVASLFAGCGGSSLGYRMAGFGVVYANELNEHAIETYEQNLAPGVKTVIDQRSVEEVRGDDILRAVRADGGAELDVLDGSPPCQSWSMAGSRKLMDDERGELFSEYVGLVEETRPRAFVAENVEGLTMGLARLPLYRVLRQLGEAGYAVHAKLLKGQWLGVPQTRHRVVILGFRADLGLNARDWFPSPHTRTTVVANVLPDVARFIAAGRPDATQAQWREEHSWPADRPAPTLSASGLANSPWHRIRVETTSGEFREPTIDDLLALSTFPPDFLIEGLLPDQWARLGNSVPPFMMRAVADRVAKALVAHGGNRGRDI
jgi:DNA (cytosine-5)-methyltransferase 1